MIDCIEVFDDAVLLPKMCTVLNNRFVLTFLGFIKGEKGNRIPPI